MKKIFFIIPIFVCGNVFAQTTIQQQTGGNTQLNILLPSQTGNNGKFLTTNGSNSSWATVSGGGGSSTYATLTDVTLTGLATNDFMKWDGTVWRNRTPAQVLSDIGAQAAGSYESSITSGTTAQYWRGDKSWQTLNASAVGLGNVTNESKATMFTSPTFTGTPVFPAASISNASLANAAVANLSGTNTGDNAVNSTYASDYRAANFIAGTNYLAPNGSAAALTSFPTLNQNTTGTAANITSTSNSSLTTLSSLSLPSTQVTGLGELATASLTASGNALKVVRVNAAATGYELATPSGGGGGSVTTTDNLFDITSDVLTARKTPLSLTDGATITWDAATGYNARVTLAGNRTLDITNPQAGDYYTITVVQDGTGNRTLTLPGGTTAVLSTAANDSSSLTGYYRNNAYEWRSSYSMAYGYTITVQALTSTPADGATAYYGSLPKAPTTTQNISKVYVRKAGTIKIANIYCYAGTAGTAESWSLYIRKNGTTDFLIATVASATNERIFNNSSLSIPMAAGDYFEIKSVQPTFATNPATAIHGGYIYIE